MSVYVCMYVYMSVYETASTHRRHESCSTDCSSLTIINASQIYSPVLSLGKLDGENDGGEGEGEEEGEGGGDEMEGEASHRETTPLRDKTVSARILTAEKDT